MQHIWPSTVCLNAQHRIFYMIHFGVPCLTMFTHFKTEHWSVKSDLSCKIWIICICLNSVYIDTLQIKLLDFLQTECLLSKRRCTSLNITETTFLIRSSDKKESQNNSGTNFLCRAFCIIMMPEGQLIHSNLFSVGGGKLKIAASDSRTIGLDCIVQLCSEPVCLSFNWLLRGWQLIRCIITGMWAVKCAKRNIPSSFQE